MRRRRAYQEQLQSCVAQSNAQMAMGNPCLSVHNQAHIALDHKNKKLGNLIPSRKNQRD